MSERLDVRRMLVRRGWGRVQRRGSLAVKKANVVWAPSNAHGDSSVSAYDQDRPLYTVGFAIDVPARVVVAACEAAASGRAPREEDRTDG